MNAAKSDDKPRRVPWIIWIAFGLVMVAGYPLSLGPVVWMVESGFLPGKGPVANAIHCFYSPVWWYLAASDVQPFQRELSWYIESWQGVQLPRP